MKFASGSSAGKHAILPFMRANAASYCSRSAAAYMCGEKLPDQSSGCICPEVSKGPPGWGALCRCHLCRVAAPP